jgi:SAM-dependent methyltransferase
VSCAAEPGLDETAWEKVARTTWGAYVSDVEKRAILEAHFLARHPADALEIGAEGGRWSRMLAGLGWTMTCTDVQADMLDLCQERLPAAKCILVEADDTRLPCESDSLHLLLCIEVPPVMNAEWFVSEASRVLRMDGLIVGVFWNLLSWRGLAVHTTDRVAHRGDYYKQSYPSWRRKLVRSGYNILYEEGYCWFPFRRASNSRLVRYCVCMEKWMGLRRLTALSPWVVFIAQRSLTDT